MCTFKNLLLYRTRVPLSLDVAEFEKSLQSQSFSRASSLEVIRQGWDRVRPNGGLVHCVNGQLLLCLAIEKKVMPAAAVNQVVKERAAVIEADQGYAPGKKALKELKERVIDELLPRALSVVSRHWVWIDPIHGWLGIDAANPARADDAVKLLLRAVDGFPLETLRVEKSPTATMTGWLGADECPAGFSVDTEAELQAPGQGRASVRYLRQTLSADELRRHIDTGKQCVRLAMTWNSKVSFVITSSFGIRQIKLLDVVETGGAKGGDEADRFDGEFALSAGEMHRLLDDLVGAFGGLAVEPLAA